MLSSSSVSDTHHTHILWIPKPRVVLTTVLCDTLKLRCSSSFLDNCVLHTRPVWCACCYGLPPYLHIILHKLWPADNGFLLQTHSLHSKTELPPQFHAQNTISVESPCVSGSHHHTDWRPSKHCYQLRIIADFAIDLISVTTTVCWHWITHSWRMKDQLDVTCYFISLIMRSTCFRH